MTLLAYIHNSCNSYVLGLRQVYNQTRQEDDHASQPWPAQAILDAGVPFYMLLESLDSLEMNSFSAAGGVDNATQLQWLRPISELLELWVAAALSSYGSSPTMIGNLLPRSTAYSEVSLKYLLPRCWRMPKHQQIVPNPHILCIIY